jgi:hypothetical protein
MADETHLDETGESLASFLNGLDSEEVQQLAEQLRSLCESPAWQVLNRVVSQHAAHVKSTSTDMLFKRLMVGKAVPDAPAMYATAGRVRGMGEVALVVQRVLSFAERQRAELEREDDGE